MINIAVYYDNKQELYYMAKVIYSRFNKKGYSTEVDIFCEEEKIKKLYDNNECIYDVVFINISDSNNIGMKLAGTIREKDSKVILIFFGYINEKIVEIFKYKPFRFLRKNYIDEDIDEAIDKIANELGDREDYFYFKTKYEENRVRVNEILYLEIINRKLKLKTINNSYIANLKKFQDIIEYFKEKEFVQIHRSCLVNKKYIMGIGNKNVVLQNGEKLLVSKYRIGEIKRSFNIKKSI